MTAIELNRFFLGDRAGLPRFFAGIRKITATAGFTSMLMPSEPIDMVRKIPTVFPVPVSLIPPEGPAVPVHSPDMGMTSDGNTGEVPRHPAPDQLHSYLIIHRFKFRRELNGSALAGAETIIQIRPIGPERSRRRPFCLQRSERISLTGSVKRSHVKYRVVRYGCIGISR